MGTQPQHPRTADRVREYTDATRSPHASKQQPLLARTAFQLIVAQLRERVRAVEQSVPHEVVPTTVPGPLTGAKIAELVYDAYYMAEYLGIDLDDEIRRAHEERMDAVKPPKGEQTKLF